MRRNPRVFHELFHIVNSDTVIVPKWERASYWSGETAALQLSLAHGAGPVLDDCKLEVSLGGESQVIALPRLEAPDVLDLGRIELQIPEMEEPSLRRIGFRSASPDGTLIAHNHHDSPSTRSAAGPFMPASCVVADEDFASVSARSATHRPRLRGIDPHRFPHAQKAIADHVRAGAKLLLLPERTWPLPFFPHWQAVGCGPRRHALAGDWASSFGWLRRSGHFARFPARPPARRDHGPGAAGAGDLDCNLLDFQARVFSGLVVGWIHKPVALGVERSYGRGRMVASTLRLLRDEPLADPTATMLTDALVELAIESRAARLEEAVRAAEAAA